MTDTQKPAGRTRTAAKVDGFSDAELDAIKQRNRELKASARHDPKKAEADGEAEVLAAIATLKEPERSIAERLHALIRAAAPSLSPKTWYGMPAYARDGQIICHFQSAQKFKTRYATIGFSDKAKLDDGSLWPVAFALTELTATEEAKIRELLRKALS